ncbi:MAG: Rossmann-like domain-containing protein [Chloroflexota bacterium]
MVWDLYDELIAEVPADLTVGECLIGLRWSLLRSRTTGMAMTPVGEELRIDAASGIAGMPVRRLAQWVKSWNPLEATLGLAAINSVLNTPEQVAGMGGRMASPPEDANPFDCLQEEMRGKRVAVVGHFPHLERLAGICHLSVLERRPLPGEYPDWACEELLPRQDFVFITAVTLVNKTLPRLLELSRGAFVVLLGPSTPLTPTLFRHGVDLLAGTVVVDPEPVWRVVKEGGCRELFKCGTQRVRLG